jgi:hypothetical protein
MSSRNGSLKTFMAALKIATSLRGHHITLRTRPDSRLLMRSKKISPACPSNCGHTQAPHSPSLTPHRLFNAFPQKSQSPIQKKKLIPLPTKRLPTKHTPKTTPEFGNPSP